MNEADKKWLEEQGIVGFDFAWPDRYVEVRRMPSVIDPKQQDRKRPYGDEGEYMNPDGAF